MKNMKPLKLLYGGTMVLCGSIVGIWAFTANRFQISESMMIVYMKKYEYKFAEIPRIGGTKVKSGDTFEECKKAIISEAEQGWRLKQIVTPFDEKSGVFASKCYQIVFEREL